MTDTVTAPPHTGIHSFERTEAADRSIRSILAILASAIASVGQVHAAPDPYFDQCHASQFVRFIGKPVADLEELHLPNARFVCHEDCVVTADVQPTRLTVIYLKKTKRITKIRCE
jgi:hypothetical protein